MYKTGTFVKGGLLGAIASELGYAIDLKPVEGGVEVTAAPAAWAAIRAELAVEAAQPDAHPLAQSLYDGIVAAGLDS